MKFLNKAHEMLQELLELMNDREIEEYNDYNPANYLTHAYVHLHLYDYDGLNALLNRVFKRYGEKGGESVDKSGAGKIETIEAMSKKIGVYMREGMFSKVLSNLD